MKILIFDDDVAREKPDFPPSLAVEVFDRADDCIAAVARTKPHLILMDFHMNSPIKGGEAIQMLRAHFGDQAPEIIGISSANSLNRTMILMGATRAIPKSELHRFLLELAAEAEQDGNLTHG